MNLHQAIAWVAHLPQPMFWPEIGARVRRKLQSYSPSRREQHKASRLEAENWCRSRAVSSSEAFEQIGVDAKLHDRFVADQSDLWVEAEAKVRNCPYQLGGSGNSAALYMICEHLQAKTVVETGVSYGWSSLAILLSLTKRADARLYSIDLPYIDKFADKWVGIAVPDHLRSHWTLYKASDRKGLPRALRASGFVDLAHYDSDKSAEGRCWAYPRLWEALRPGGIFISDDISDDMGFVEFCDTIAVDPIVVADNSKFQGIIVKALDVSR